MKLKTLIITAFLLLGVVLALGYSLLTGEYLFRGLDSVLLGDMERTMTTLSKSGSQGKTRGRFNEYDWARDWQELPQSIRDAFSEPPEQPMVLYKQHNGRWNRKPDVVHFVMRYTVGQQTGSDDPEYWYISTSMSRPQSGSLFDQSLDDSRHTLLLVAAIAVALVGFIAALLYLMIAGPTGRLLDWTRQLDSESMQRDTPDFGYPELNELAGLIHASMSRVQETLAREQAFLRYASHELRTPIAVIRNNIELLGRMSDRGFDIQDHRVAVTLERLERAGVTMSQLTETLLWLSREDVNPLPEQPRCPAVLIQQLCDELQFLLNNKAVTMELALDKNWSAELPETPLRIVLGNLIRNAFQHTWEGTVTITQQQGLIRIDNVNHQADSAGQDLGFGLGLQLTQQLAERLGWRYENTPGELGHQVVLDLSK